jgi:hypothetical protein
MFPFLKLLQSINAIDANIFFMYIFNRNKFYQDYLNNKELHMHGRIEHHEREHFEHRHEGFRPGFFGPRPVVVVDPFAPVVVNPVVQQPVVVVDPFAVQPTVVVEEPMFRGPHHRF